MLEVEDHVQMHLSSPPFRPGSESQAQVAVVVVVVAAVLLHLELLNLHLLVGHPHLLLPEHRNSCEMASVLPEYKNENNSIRMHCVRIIQEIF